MAHPVIEDLNAMSPREFINKMARAYPDVVIHRWAVWFK
jgi:hypothetical protein